MSAPALALAIRDTLLTKVRLNGDTIDKNTCDVCFGPEPKPGCGQLFLAVHLGRWIPESADYDLSEQYEVNVTISMKLGEVPQDMFGEEAWTKAATGLDAVARTVITALHQNQQVRLTANDGQPYSIGTAGSRPDGFYTTVQFTGAQAPVFRKASWFNMGEPLPADADDSQAAQCGVSQTLTFGKAQRAQTIAGMT